MTARVISIRRAIRVRWWWTVRVTTIRGAPAVVTDVLTVMSRVREPWPDDQTWTPSDVALSDVVYAGDAVLGVVNGSAAAYPKPQALWLNHDRDVAEGPTFTARLAVAHAHARKGRPVAAVRFTATDGTTTVETLVTAMSVASYSASGLSVPHFAGDLDFSALAPGALVTVDAEIRPWVGPAFTVSTDAEAYPSVNLTVLKVLNDFDGSYGRAYAYVDPGAGNDGPGRSTVMRLLRARRPMRRWGRRCWASTSSTPRTTVGQMSRAA